MAYSMFTNYLRDKLYFVRTNSHTIENVENCVSTSEYISQDVTQPIFKLPEEVLLNIFSFLPAEDLVRCTEVCRLWYRVSQDRILWEHTLAVESKTWQTVTCDGPLEEDDSSQPQHPKTIYLQCKNVKPPEKPGLMKQTIRFWFPRKKAKLLMVGPGLDSARTRKVVHKMVNDKCTEFVPVGMQPGVNGFGTGLTFDLKINEQTHQFDLITLYAHRAQIRGEYINHNERIRSGLLFNSLNPEQSLDQLEATDQVKTLCQTIDGVVFLIDAEDKLEEFEQIHHELRAFLAAFPQQNRLNTNIPILVLSLIKENQSLRNVSSLNVAKLLRLFNLNNQWFVQDAIVQDMTGISRGIHWIIQKWLSA